MTIARTLHELTPEHIGAFTHWNLSAGKNFISLTCRGPAPSPRTGESVHRWFEIRHFDDGFGFEPLLKQWHVRICPAYQESRIRITTPQNAAALRVLIEIVTKALDNETDANLRVRASHVDDAPTIAELRERLASQLRSVDR